MWRYIADSQQGPSHAAEGGPCQDSARVLVLGDGAAGTLVACVADGAGTSAMGAEGSAIACDVMIDCAASYLQANGGWAAFGREDAIEWCENARREIQACADKCACSVRDLATTLCVAIVAPSAAAFFQIGDGAITLKSGGVYGVVFWPQSGEYANSTNFLTSNAFREQLEFRVAARGFSDVALFTDGIERLALQFECRSPHAPFFDPLFAALRACDSTEQLAKDLGRFLQSDSIRTRSDDDKTLILASRVPAEVGEPV